MGKKVKRAKKDVDGSGKVRSSKGPAGPKKVSKAKGPTDKDLEEKVEKEAEEFKRRIKTGAFTPSTMKKSARVPVKRTRKPFVAGVFLILICIIGLVNSSNLILTAVMDPLYSPEEGSLKGYVLNEDGERLVGAIVIIEDTGMVSYTNSKGKYSFKDVDKGERVLIASYPGYRTVRFPTLVLGGTQLQGVGDTNLTVKRTSTTEYDFTTDTSSSVHGWIQDKNGNPIKNATVTNMESGTNETTGEDGFFGFGSYPSGPVELRITRQNYLDTRVMFYATLISDRDHVFELTPGTGNETIDLTNGTTTLVGKVLDYTNGPVQNAVVEINGTAIPVGPDGSFTVEVEAGEVSMTASAIGMSSRRIIFYINNDGGNVTFQIKDLSPKELDGDREALRNNLTICGVVITGMSLFILFTAISSIQRRRFWVVVTGSLFGSVFMLVTFQYGIILGLIAFGILLFSRREFE